MIFSILSALFTPPSGAVSSLSLVYSSLRGCLFSLLFTPPSGAISSLSLVYSSLRGYLFSPLMLFPLLPALFFTLSLSSPHLHSTLLPPPSLPSLLLLPLFHVLLFALLHFTSPCTCLIDFFAVYTSIFDQLLIEITCIIDTFTVYTSISHLDRT